MSPLHCYTTITHSKYDNNKTKHDVHCDVTKHLWCKLIFILNGKQWSLEVWTTT